MELGFIVVVVGGVACVRRVRRRVDPVVLSQNTSHHENSGRTQRQLRAGARRRQRR